MARNGFSSARNHWRAKPATAAVLRAAIVLVPVAASVGATIGLRVLLPRPQALGAVMAWWAVLLGLAAVVAVTVQRAARRLTPLVTLLKLSMLFPDRAPSRIAVARQSGSVRRLSARLEAVRADPSASDEAASAETILALATALQSHDRRTRGHAERVRVYTDLLAEEMGLSRDDRYRLRWAALLHDIGKLTVSSNILNKPAKLDDHEWEVMRRHPEEGARIATPLLEWLGPWAGAITDHHERFDGGGYPRGKTGSEISVAGRIVAVADAYDTMTAARSYKRAMPVRAAREELARCAGGQFDPAVVRAFFAISLPRLVWRTGPVSYLAQLPWLTPLQEVGRQVIAVAGQSAVAASVAVGVTAATVAGLKPPLDPQPGGGRQAVAAVSVHRPSAGDAQVAARPSPSPMAEPRPATGSRQHKAPRRAGHGTGSTRPGPSPSSSQGDGGGGTGSGGSGGSGGSDATGGSSGSGGSNGTGDSGSGGTSPSPQPSPTSDPLPLPSVSVPPLPTPSLPLPSVSVSLGLGK